MRGAARRVLHGEPMLLGLIDDDEEDPRLHAVGHGQGLAADQTPRNGRLASHPAITAVSTAIAP